jgi:hypothetical protein
MLVILLAGAGLLISYNVLRYGKVLEFGQDYQLTALDPSAQGFCPKGILGAFAHYWFALPNAQSDFPYFTTKIWKTNVDTHPYDVGAIGLLVNPFFWGVGLLPFAIKYAKGWEQKTMYVLLPFAAIITSISIYCLGGTCPRYMMGIWPLASLASFSDSHQSSLGLGSGSSCQADFLSSFDRWEFIRDRSLLLNRLQQLQWIAIRDPWTFL